MAEEKNYEVVPEAGKMMSDLVTKYPDVLWRVKPNNIAVLGVTNKDRSKKCKEFVKVTPVKGSQKALNRLYNVPVAFIIEVYWSDWNEWTPSLRYLMLMKAMLMVSEEAGKTVKMDCKDFRILIDALGVDWEQKEVLPHLLDEDVKFNLDLRPGLDGEDGEATEGTGGDEVEPD